MADLSLAMVAKETLRISEQGYYYCNGEKIFLDETWTPADYEKVIVFDEDKLMFISEDIDNYFQSIFQYSGGANIFLHSCDSFEMAKEFEHPLIMNFANAVHPGGGFLNGARAQEESLCRCSTLYKSLSSAKATEMYQYNRRCNSPVDSDYMLLSPNVVVFRDKDLQFLSDPFSVSVITLPAPNKNGRARYVQQEILDKVMMNRIRKMFWAAARYGYRNLVLGAWGCGAFGHDTKQVAGYFYKILIEEKYDRLFDNIAFAILNDESKIQAFSSVFGDCIDDLTSLCRKGHLEKAESYYIESTSDFPVCNHTIDVGKENLGYTQGIMAGGIPFEAELWRDSDALNLSIIIPELYSFHETSEKHLQQGNTVAFHDNVRGTNCGVLLIGMADRGMVDDINVVFQYISYLKDNQLIEFCTDTENGAILLVTDINGNDYVNVIIMLEDKDATLAKTPLMFRPFPGQKKPTYLKLVK